MLTLAQDESALAMKAQAQEKVYVQTFASQHYLPRAV
jgi:hypothetical protein